MLLEIPYCYTYLYLFFLSFNSLLSVVELLSTFCSLCAQNLILWWCNLNLMAWEMYMISVSFCELLLFFIFARLLSFIAFYISGSHIIYSSFWINLLILRPSHHLFSFQFSTFSHNHIIYSLRNSDTHTILVNYYRRFLFTGSHHPMHHFYCNYL